MQISPTTQFAVTLQDLPGLPAGTQLVQNADFFFPTNYKTGGDTVNSFSGFADVPDHYRYHKDLVNSQPTWFSLKKASQITLK